MLCKAFNQFKNRQLLRNFAVIDGANTGYALTLEVKTMEDGGPANCLPGFRTRLKEVPWAGTLTGTYEKLLRAESAASVIEESVYGRTGKAYDVFVKPEGSNDYYSGRTRALGLSTGSHHILLLPKGTLPKDGVCAMKPNGPLREAGGFEPSI